MMVLALVFAVSGFSSRLCAASSPPHHLSAANFMVVQNDTANTADSVTVTTTLSINDMRVRPGSNRGDYNLQIGDLATNNAAQGMLLVAVTQNGRDNGELADEQKNYAAPAFDVGANGYWAVVQDVTSDRAEFNMDCAVAYFRYADWLCGWARNATAANGGTNNLFTGSPDLLLGTHFKGISAGRSRVDLRNLGIYSTSDTVTNTGVLLVNHGKNEGNFALSVANADGTWEIYVKDNFGNANNPNALEQDPAAFVFVPTTNTTVVSGKFGLDATGTNAVILVHSGGAPMFSVTNFATGRYRLTIPGGSPTAGVLITSAEGGKTINFDNVVSYEADGNSWIIESRDTGVFPPVLEACTNEPVASFIYIPAATPGVAVNPTNILTTAEFGLAASFSVQLDLAPTNVVTIPLSSSNPAEGTVSPDTLTFDPSNWNIPQVVTVTGQDDDIADGPMSYQMLLGPATSADANYDGLDPKDVEVVNVDNEQPGVSVSPSFGLSTGESGKTATFVAFLNRAPTADVVISLTSDNLAEGTVAPATLTFTPADWNVTRTVTVTGVDDHRRDGNQTFRIITTVASDDASYASTHPPDVTVVNEDDDSPGLLWAYKLPLTVAEGGTTNYTVALATQPDANVTVQVTVNDASVVTVSPATLTFTPLDWNTPKVVTITGLDNLITNGTVAFTLTNRVTTTDPLYADFNGNKLLPGVRLDNEALIVLSPEEAVYGLGMPPIGIDGRARIEDVDASNYNGGTLTVTLTAQGMSQDRIEIRNDGTAAGQISVAGDQVSYEGVVMGAYAGGQGLTPLQVTLNGNATLSAVQRLIQSITFFTPNPATSVATRLLTVTLDDGVGGSASALKAVRVGTLRLMQYQEGGDHGYGIYTGAADTALSQVGHATPWPQGRTPAPQEGLLIDWPDGGTPNESQVLMRFDHFIGTNHWQVPSNAVVVAAELLVRVNNTGDGGKLHRMLMPWDAEADTWDSWVDGIQPDDLEARSVYESQLGVEDGSGATGTGVISIGVTPDVQAWVNGETNYGWVMLGWPLRTDGTGLSPSEAPAVEDRPCLRVFWLEPSYTLASFQQGVNGYVGTHDTDIRQGAPDISRGADLSIWSDAPDASGTNETQVLIRFDDLVGAAAGQIPAGARILAAILDLPALASDSMGDGGRFFAMLQPWDDATATWNMFGGNGIQPDGVEAALTPSAVGGNSSLDPDMQGTISTIEVTADVQAWVDGVRPNYGWTILPWPGGSNGWGIRSSEFITLVYPSKPEAERPRLRVYYSASQAVAPASIQLPLLTGGRVELAFKGTPGKTYTVQRSSELGTTWTSLGYAAVDSNGTGAFTDATPPAAGAVYRILAP